MFSINIKPAISSVDDLLNGSTISEYLKTSDHVVKLTGWDPLSRSGQDFKSHRMVQVDDDHVEFRISFQSMMLSLSIFTMGVVVMVMSIFSKQMGMSGSSNLVMMFLIGLIFTGVGLYLFTKAREKICINRAYPAIYKGDIDPSNAINPQTIDYFYPLERLHAIQLLQKYVESEGKSSFYVSYELNLVLNDGTRIKVLDHGNTKAIIKQSNALALFLDVPLWKVTWNQ